MSELPTVEIFRESASDIGYSDMVATRGAIELVSESAGPLNVIGQAKRLRLTGKSGRVISDNIRQWPEFQADFNIVLTKSPVGYSSVQADSPMSHTGLVLTPNHSSRLAIVRSERGSNLQKTVSHYLGHLLTNRLIGSHLDKYGHCSEDECLMQGSLEWNVDEGTAKLARIVKGLSGQNLLKDLANAKGERFCGDCKSTLRQSALQIFLHKNGLTQPR